MAAIITNDDIKAFNVSNKFGFLNVSDSDDEGRSWQKPKKPAKQTNTAPKKKPSKPQTPSNASSVVGLNSAPSQNIISQQPSQGLSKNAKRRARKKKQAAEANKDSQNVPEDSAPPLTAPVVGPTDEEVFQQQLEQAIKLSKVEGESKVISEELSPRVSAQNSSQKKKKKASAQVNNENAGTDERGVVEAEEDEEEEEEDLFVPVIEDIKDVIRRISKEDEIPITDIPIDNNQLLRKRALELQEINSEFKQKLNSLLRVGYKYKRKYQKEKDKNKLLGKVLSRCESAKKSDLVKKILQHEETEQIMTKQIEELLEELEKERTKLSQLYAEKKGGAVKKVSFSSDN